MPEQVEVQQSAPVNEVRQKALQKELSELIGVVGPGPMVDLLLNRAFELNATDIHFDPTDLGLRIRVRVDGLLHEVLHLPISMMTQVVSRLKVMAKMDITAKRIAQDGHIANHALKQRRDIRVGSGPTIYGERLVLRLMPDQQQLTKLESLGFESDQIETVRGFMASPHGLILSAGPVGSGKTTTLYSCLDILNDPTKSLTTIEDPVERRIDGVNQIQIDAKIKFNFVKALRGVLRQDPDVIMVGEIRDPETAHIACRAGLTGVTVLSSIHANDTASTIDVFRELHVPLMFISGSVEGIIAQRLVRRVCQHCKEVVEPDSAACNYLGIDSSEKNDVDFVKGRGCDYCFNTGYFGRIGVFEVMKITEEIREAILKNRSQSELVSLARRQGMKTLEDSAKQKVLNGITSLEEIHRVMTSRVI